MIRGNPKLNRGESKAEHRADIAGFVDVLTELDKMSRWGRDRRHTERLTVRQRTMLSMAALRSAIYVFLSTWIGVPSVFFAWKLFGPRGAAFMAVVGLLPVAATVTWLTRRLLHGQGQVWAEAAAYVCRGILNASLCFLFANVVLVALGVLAHRWISAFYAEFSELTAWALEGLDLGAEEKVRGWIAAVRQSGEMLTGDYMLPVIALLAVSVLCVAVPACAYFYVRTTESRVSRKVEELFL